MIVSLLSLPLVACAQVPPQSTVAYGQATRATVIEVQPLYESIIVGKNCQPVNVVVQQQQPNTAGAIIGGLIGGAVGSRFGGGSGRIVATGAGAIAGTMIGGQYQQGYPQQQATMHCTPVTTLRQTGTAYIADYNGIRFSGNTYSNLRVGDTVFVNVTTIVNPGE